MQSLIVVTKDEANNDERVRDQLRAAGLVIQQDLRKLGVIIGELPDELDPRVLKNVPGVQHVAENIDLREQLPIT